MDERDINEQGPQVEATPADEAIPATEEAPTAAEAPADAEAPVPEATPAAEAPAEPTTQLEHPAPLDPTVERPRVEEPPTQAPDPAAAPAEAPTPTAPANNPQLNAAPSPVSRIRDFASRHKMGVCIGAVLLVAAIALLVVAGVRALNVPSQDVVDADARTRVAAPDYDGGKWGDPTALAVTNVQVKSIKRSATAIDSSAAQFGASGYAEAEVVVTFENDSVSAEKTATLGYALIGGEWVGIGEETNANAAFAPKAGVNEAQLTANVSSLLERAEQVLQSNNGSTDGGVGEMSLVGLYSGGEFSVTSSDFSADAQTDVVTLHCEKATAFDARECDLTVTFGFRSVNGLWEITQVDVPTNAKNRNFSPLLGTWTGTFQSQETSGGKCLGAVGNLLTVTLTAQSGATDKDGAGAQLVGSVSGLAHYHANPSDATQTCDGDTTFADAVLTADYVDGGTTSSDLAFFAELPDQAEGSVSVTLEFGTTDDADAVVAIVETTYEYTESFLFIPYSETAVYKDTYLLHKSE